MTTTKKIKVLECIRQGQIGGGESHLLSLVENLDRTKYDPIVLSFTDGPMVDRLKEMEVPTHVIKSTKAFDFNIWKKVKHFLISEKIELIHAHGSRANSNLNVVARKLKIPIIYSIHGWSFHNDQPFWKKKIRILGESWLTKNSTVNISVSASNRDSGKIYISAFNSTVVNNGIDENKFNPAKYDCTLRNELGYRDDDIIVLFIARFTSHKQPLTLIKAFAKALPQLPEIKLLMVGEGDQKETALQLVNELNIKDKIKFLPFRQDVPNLLAAADIFVLPSLWEGLPIGLLEAMSMGKAIIATEVDGTMEIVKNEENGLLITVANLESELASAILRMGKDSRLRKRFGAAARETVKNSFNAGKMTRQIEAIYEKLAEKK